jgi:uncharacterized cupredoxin-like copper-binding protein
VVAHIRTVTLVAALIASSTPIAAHSHEAGPHGSKPKGSIAAAGQKSFGIPGDARNVDRTIEIVMDDRMRFEPAIVTVTEGQTIRFVQRNAGAVMHEMVIGTRSELERHAEMMRKQPSMAHDEPYMVHVAPGKRGQLVWKFDRMGDFEFACLIPGHFEAGMRGVIKVVSK